MCDNDFHKKLQEKDLVMKRILCSCVGVFAVSAAVSAAEDVWHYRPTKDAGKGTYGYLVSRAVNWTNETETITGTPPRGAKVKIHDNSGLKISTLDERDRDYHRHAAARCEGEDT